MRPLLPCFLFAAVPVIAILVAAAFVLPADFPWFPHQLLLAAIGLGGVALAGISMFRTCGQLGSDAGPAGAPASL